VQTQRQKPTARPRPKRTVGELAAAGLILAWGVLTGVFFWPRVGFQIDTESSVLLTLLFSQGIACFLAGVAALLRLSKGTQALLTLAGLCFLSLTGAFLWFSKKYSAFGSYLFPLLISTLIGLVFLALGRWFGRLEDSDAGDSP
jgi:hypothetical protein